MGMGGSLIKIDQSKRQLHTDHDIVKRMIEQSREERREQPQTPTDYNPDLAFPGSASKPRSIKKINAATTKILFQGNKREIISKKIRFRKIQTRKSDGKGSHKRSSRFSESSPIKLSKFRVQK